FKKENPVYGAKQLPTEVQSAVNQTDGQMIIEVAIPISYIEKVQSNWKSVRLGIGYYDFDDNGENSTTHFWYPGWTESDDLPGSGMLFKE
ncbi:MAG: hypothetical protein CMB80_32575, partial [Flammeovirgaceae bacterium]|nr:hypothetical protein [Flammeovirgaceae bacterium]